MGYRHGIPRRLGDPTGLGATRRRAGPGPHRRGVCGRLLAPALRARHRDLQQDEESRDRENLRGVGALTMSADELEEFKRQLHARVLANSLTAHDGALGFQTTLL